MSGSSKVENSHEDVAVFFYGLFMDATAALAAGRTLPVRCYLLPESPAYDEADTVYAARLGTLLARLGLSTRHVDEALARSTAAAATTPEPRA